MRHRLKLKGLLFALLAVAILASAAPADKVRWQGVGYDGSIIGLKQGELELQAGGDTTKTFPLSEVQIESAEEYPDLAGLEENFFETKGLEKREAADGLQNAATSYEKILDDPNAKDWLKALAQVRLVTCYAGTARFTNAVETFIKLGRSDPNLVAKLSLPEPDLDQPEDNRAALDLIDAELKEKPPYAGALLSARAAILLQQGKHKEALSAVQHILQSGTKEQQQWAAIKEIEVLTLLERFDEAHTKWEGAREQLFKAYAPELAYWGGRILYGKGQYIASALEMMRVPILYPQKDQAQTADALFWAGQAMEKAREPTIPKQEIIAVYNEAVQKYPDTGGAKKAKAAVERLQK